EKVADPPGKTDDNSMYGPDAIIARIFTQSSKEDRYIITSKNKPPVGPTAGKPRPFKPKDVATMSEAVCIGYLMDDHPTRTFAGGVTYRAGNDAMLNVSYDKSGGKSSRITDATGQIATASKIWFFDEYDSK